MGHRSKTHPYMNSNILKPKGQRNIQKNPNILLNFADVKSRKDVYEGVN